MIRLVIKAFKHTAILLVPTVLLFLITVLPEVYSEFTKERGPGFGGSLTPQPLQPIVLGYLILLSHNIPFFLGSFTLFLLLERGFHKLSAISLSTLIGCCLWLVTMNLSMRLPGIPDIGMSAIWILLIGIITLLVFIISAGRISSRSNRSI